MTPLRQRMSEDMQVRNLAPHTQRSYLQQVSQFARHFGRSPELLGPDDIRAYQLHLTKDRRLSASSILVAVAAIRFLYKVTLKRDWNLDEVIPSCRKPQALPVVMSPDEVSRFLNAAESLKHRTILTVCYAAGLRVSEAVRLTPDAIDSQQLLPVPYFHVVFTLPAAVAEISFHNKAVVYAILFRTAAKALRRVAADPRYLGAEIGAVAVLHSWGQALHHHPHLHCIVRGGGISPDQTRWIACKPGFFLPVRVLSRQFRALFLEQLRAAFANGELRCSGALSGLADPDAFATRLDAADRIDWVVYSKPPFAGPEQVLGYLGRYTHRVAIANSRLVGLNDGQVNFTWKDYRQDGRTKVMTLAADESIRRFLQHTVPDGFHRIRHVGFLANRHRTAKLALCRDLLAAPPPSAPEPSRRWQDRLRDLTGHDVEVCPGCGGRMLPHGTLRPCSPPRPPMWCDSS